MMTRCGGMNFLILTITLIIADVKGEHSLQQTASKSRLKPLPINVNDFEELINGGCVYVDKTKAISEMIKYDLSIRFKFLSRPFGFGKSLLVSTIEAIFRNKKALFKGTEIYESDRKWIEHPIIKIDVSTLSCSSPKEFENSLWDVLKDVAKSYGLPELQGCNSTGSYVRSLMEGLGGKFSQRIVILIDESDHPFIENFVPYKEAHEFTRILTDLHRNLNIFSNNIEFGLTTGVYKFTAFIAEPMFGVAYDASHWYRSETTLGFTEEEVKQYFGVYLGAIAFSRNVTKEEIYGELCSMYHGYTFSSEMGMNRTIFNPYSILRYFQSQKLQNFWMESQSSSTSNNVLQNLVRLYPVEALVFLRNRENIYYRPHRFLRMTGETTSEDLENFMFQSGYFTVVSHLYTDNEVIFTISFANREVREAFQKQVEKFMNLDVQKLLEIIDKMAQAIEEIRMNDFVSKMSEYMLIVANFPFPERAYKTMFFCYSDCDRHFKELLERKERSFWLNFHTVLRLTGAFEAFNWTDDEPKIISKANAIIIIRKIEGSSCFVFVLSTLKINAFDECVGLDNNGDLDNFYDREVKIPVVCIGIKFDASSNGIVDWNASKFARVTTHTEERI